MASYRELRAMAPANIIVTGTRVAYSRNFLQSCGMYTGWQPFARGVVLSVEHLKGSDTALATVRWEHRKHISQPDQPAGSVVNVRNLVREDRIHLEAV